MTPLYLADMEVNDCRLDSRAAMDLGQLIFSALGRDLSNSCSFTSTLTRCLDKRTVVVANLLYQGTAEPPNNSEKWWYVTAFGTLW